MKLNLKIKDKIYVVEINYPSGESNALTTSGTVSIPEDFPKDQIEKLKQYLFNRFGFF